MAIAAFLGIGAHVASNIQATSTTPVVCSNGAANYPHCNADLSLSAEWKTYRNEKYGYALDYPKSFFAFEWPGQQKGERPIAINSVGNKDATLFTPVDLRAKNWDDGDYLTKPFVRITKENGSAFISGSKTVEDFWSKLAKNDEKDSEVNVLVNREKIGGVDFIIFKQKGWEIGTQSNGSSLQALFMKDGSFFWVRSGAGLDQDSFYYILRSLKFDQPAAPGTGDNQTPYIGSVSPSSASVGSTIEVRGSGLTGFEGDIYFFFERADGKIARLPGSISTQMNGDAAGAQTARILLKEPCQQGQTVYADYSGFSSICDYVQLTPGTYKIYTQPWGKMSNKVQFTIVANPASPVSSLNTYTDSSFGFSFLYPSAWQVSKQGNVISLATAEPHTNPATITEVSGSQADDSTGKWGTYIIKYDSAKDKWVITMSNERDGSVYDTVISTFRKTDGGLPMFDGGVRTYGFGWYDYIVPLSFSKFLIIRGPVPDERAQADDNQLVNLVRTISIPTTASNTDWKTYVNTQYGFKMTYPPTWTVQVGTHYGGGIHNEPGYVQFALIDPVPTNGPWNGIVFSVQNRTYADNQALLNAKQTEINNNPNIKDKWSAIESDFLNMGQAVFITENESKVPPQNQIGCKPTGTLSESVFVIRGQYQFTFNDYRCTDWRGVPQEIMNTFRFTNN